MLQATPQWSAFDGVRLLVVGDLMLDRYTWGETQRISPEAPVMVLEAQEDEVRLGGAASVASLLAGLEASAAVAGVIGDDADGRVLTRLLGERHGRLASATPDVDAAKGRRDLYLVDPTRPTTVKQRLLGRAANRYPHQILRLDRECRRPLARELEKRLAAFIGLELPRCQAVLISDYAKGVCTPSLIRHVIQRAREITIPVLVDPARGVDFARYRGASLVKANRQEAQWALGCPLLHRRHAYVAAREMCQKLQLQAAVVTLDGDGVVLATANGDCRHFEAQVHEVCDVTGAGDTVLAVLGACLAAKFEPAQAVELANRAAMLQVEKIGVGQITRAELARAVSEDRRAKKPAAATACQQACGGRTRCSKTCRRPNTKIVSLDELVRWADEARRRGQRIAFTNGCFDLLHVGHAACLAQAAQLGDLLVVAVNSDRSVGKLKGAGRPVIDETNRAAMVAALEAVDRVVVLDEDDPCALLRRLKPEVLVKGGGYRLEQVVGREIVEAYGGRIELTEHVRGASTSQIVASLAVVKGGAVAIE